MKRFCFPYFIISFSILNYVFHTQVDFLIVLDCILIADSQLRKISVIKKIMLKNCLKLFIVLVLPLYCVAYTTHKITIFMNHSKTTWKLLEITSKIIFLNTFLRMNLSKNVLNHFLIDAKMNWKRQWTVMIWSMIVLICCITNVTK